MSWSWVPEFFTQILKGLGVTLLIFGVSVILGSVLALGLAFVQMGGNWVLKLLTRWFCLALRSTPLLLQLFYSRRVLH